jgi:hypothetical protein
MPGERFELKEGERERERERERRKKEDKKYRKRTKDTENAIRYNTRSPIFSTPVRK